MDNATEFLGDSVFDEVAVGGDLSCDGAAGGGVEEGNVLTEGLFNEIGFDGGGGAQGGEGEDRLEHISLCE